MQDTLYVFDENFKTFFEALEVACRIFELSQDAHVRAESFRYSIDQKGSKHFKLALPHTLQTQGWHFFGSAKDAFFTQQLQLQTQILKSESIPFTISSDQYGKADSILLKGASHESLHLPFEDRIENAQRFFNKFFAAFEKTFNLSKTQVQNQFENFYMHLQKHLEDEKEYLFEKKSFFTKATPLVSLKPKKSQVGRHTLFHSLEIQTHPYSQKIYDLFFECVCQHRPQTSKVFLQFFSTATPSKIFFSDEHFLEHTFLHTPLTLEEIFAWKKHISTDLSPEQMVDAFCLFESLQPKGLNVSELLITLRKTNIGFFEVRLNFFDPHAKNHEKAVTILEDALQMPISPLSKAF